MANMFRKVPQTDKNTKLVTQKSGPPPKAKPNSTTTIHEKNLKFSWAIRNLKMLQKTAMKELRSPIFPIYFENGSPTVHKLRILCKPQYSNVDGSIESMTLKLETILQDGSFKYVDEKQEAYYHAAKTEGHFRFETADDGIQITIDDESGPGQSQFSKDGSPRDFGICDAKDVNFKMEGLSSPDFEVTLLFKILHFTN